MNRFLPVAGLACLAVASAGSAQAQGVSYLDFENGPTVQSFTFTNGGNSTIAVTPTATVSPLGGGATAEKVVVKNNQAVASYSGGFGYNGSTNITSDLTMFNFQLKPDPTTPIRYKIALQEDDNGNGSYEVGDDEFITYIDVPAGTAFIPYSIPLSTFTADNSQTSGGNDIFDPVKTGGSAGLINVVIVYESQAANTTTTVIFDDFGFSGTNGRYVSIADFEPNVLKEAFAFNAGGSVVDTATVTTNSPLSGGTRARQIRVSNAPGGFAGGLGFNGFIANVPVAYTSFNFNIIPDAATTVRLKLELQDDDDNSGTFVFDNDDVFLAFVDIAPNANGQFITVSVPFSQFTDANTGATQGNGVLDPRTAAGGGNGGLLQLAIVYEDQPVGTTSTLVFDDFTFTPTPVVVPVELAGFTGRASANAVELNWTTASEKNNAGFSVQQRTESGTFATLGFVKGHGTTVEAQRYGYRAAGLAPGRYTFRLVQQDLDGTTSTSPEIAVTVGTPTTFALSSAAPNPFNPSTTLTLSLPVAANATATLYDVLGRQVRTLIDGQPLAAGSQPITVDGSGLASGTYFVRVSLTGQTGGATQTLSQRILLAK